MVTEPREVFILYTVYLQSLGIRIVELNCEVTLPTFLPRVCSCMHRYTDLCMQPGCQEVTARPHLCPLPCSWGQGCSLNLELTVTAMLGRQQAAGAHHPRLCTAGVTHVHLRPAFLRVLTQQGLCSPSHLPVPHPSPSNPQLTRRVL